MKICFAVCEYNPFHNGHCRHLRYIREEIRPDAVAVIMSGNFTQRGEAAVLDKYTRATHAVKAGADVVFELPVVFATAPAEIFAKGGVKLAAATKGEKSLCFGTESAEKDKLLATAKALLSESRQFKKLLAQQLATGVSHVRAKVNALKEMNVDGLDLDLLKSPNNILAIEYAKAIISKKYDIDPIPIIRRGGEYDSDSLETETPSALAIRRALSLGDFAAIKDAVPDFVFGDLDGIAPPDVSDLVFYSVLATPKSELKKITDCTEGLENRIKAVARGAGCADNLIEKLKTKRYTYSRLSRILLSCMLKTTRKLAEDSLRSDLYLKVLAIKKERSDVLSYFANNCAYPVITRKDDVRALSGTALKCFERDVFANDVYNFVTGKHSNEFMMMTV